jgi:hypothetical protein
VTRGGVCGFPLLLDLATGIFLGSESHGIHEHILLSLFLTILQPEEPISCIYPPLPPQLESDTLPAYNLPARPEEKAALSIITLLGPHRKYRFSVK